MILIEGWAVPIHILFEISHLVNIFFEHNFYIFFLSLSFIAKGLVMCQLEGVITTKIVLLYTLTNTGFELFLCTNRLN